MTKTINIKSYLRVGLITGLFAFIIFYTILKTHALTHGVELSISGIQNGEVSTKNLLKITGKAIHAKHIHINGREILVNEKNEFSEDLVLSPGYNVISINAEDKFNKKTEKLYQVLYSPPEDSNVALQDKPIINSKN